tara:strand:+ start:495 stop:1049 length:555 start_codon:yes stop_codon:yes gene_type:complete
MELNFKDALKLAIKEEDNYKNEEICLITRNPLKEYDSIKLSCGHAFQYTALVDSLIKNRHYKNSRHIQNKPKCPYCRNSNNIILPYVPELVKVKYYGINHSLNCILPKSKKCTYKLKNGNLCNKVCLNNYCKHHGMKENSKQQLENKTVKELKLLAKTMGIKKYSRLRKNELITLIKENKNLTT